MTCPGVISITVTQPVKIAEGIASTGTLPFVEIMDPRLPVRNFEQALAVNVRGRGIVLIVGCGHPTLARLVERARAAFGAPVIGVIGGLHLAGASETMLQGTISVLKELRVQIVGLSPHDSDQREIARVRAAFPHAYEDVKVGRTIRMNGVMP
jgi:7,8-dihydropterin-6-yl-methyl-4-(beta-D-ribofuranosyl)aminobenzene 5'-phosphate synthase